MEMNRLEEQRILIVDDDQLLRLIIRESLEEAGYDVVEAESAEEAKELFLSEHPCLILLDLILPKMSGEQFCEWVRAHEVNDVSIIMISSKARTVDKVYGLKIGADDYMTKPIDTEELLAKIEAVLRRTGLFCQKVVHDGLCIKPRKGVVLLYDKSIHLTKHEFLLLYHFMDNPNVIFTRADLVNHLYQFDEKDVLDRTIDVHIKKLRAKIEEDPKNPKRILTVRGIGYKYVK